MKITNMKMGQILVQAGILSEEKLNNALNKQKHSKKRLGEVLIENGYITEMQMIRSLEKQIGIPYVDLSYVTTDSSLSGTSFESDESVVT